jgi:hypothetical protein
MTPDPFANSLCHMCASHRSIRGRNTAFIMCTALPEKYPRQPVLACPAFRRGADPDRDSDAHALPPDPAKDPAAD